MQSFKPPKLEGTEPIKPLEDIFKNTKLLKFPIDNGITLENELEDKSKISRVSKAAAVSSPNLPAPINRLPERETPFNLKQNAQARIFPLNKFQLKSTAVMFRHFPNESGKFLVN